MKYYWIKLIAFIFLLQACSASQHLVIRSSKPARIEVDGAVICNSTPCEFNKGCFRHGDRSFLEAYPLKGSDGYTQRKVARGQCDIGADNLINVYFDMSSTEDTSNRINQERINEARESESTRQLFNSLSNSAQKTGAAIAGSNSYNASGSSCGLKPLPNIGCKIGNCVDGSWQQICDSNGAIVCGIKPIPAIGCRVGKCIDGAWQQICDSNSAIVCGLKPTPAIGCRIGKCVDGQWEQICN